MYSMRNTRLPAFLIASLAAAALSGLAAFAADERPSVVVFIGDDIGQYDYGCYGNQGIRTASIDALAEGGLLFRNAFLTTSSCSPSRISILTGKYPHQTGAEDLHMPLPEGEKFVSSYLREAGYFTGHMKKTHYGPNGIKQFDWYSGNLKEFPQFLDAAGEKPFFMWVGFNDAHRPYSKGAVDPPHGPEDVTVPPYLVDDGPTRADLALYYDEVSRMDENIGEMVEAMKSRGRFENTLIIVIGDNGMPFPRAKGTVYDSGIGTPLVVSWPGKVPAGKSSEALASVIDLAPTILAAAGLETPPQMEGESRLELFQKPSSKGREHIFAERNWHNADEHIRCIRGPRFKLIKNAYLDLPFGHPSDCSSCPSWRSLIDKREAGELTAAQQPIFLAPRPEYEFYDLASDPHELNNLIDSAEHAETIARLKTELEKWRKETDDFPPSQRRRADNTNRVTGDKFTKEIGPLVDGEPEPLRP